MLSKIGFIDFPLKKPLSLLIKGGNSKFKTCPNPWDSALKSATVQLGCSRVYLGFDRHYDNT
jgi:hypothetical protein